MLGGSNVEWSNVAGGATHIGESRVIWGPYIWLCNGVAIFGESYIRGAIHLGKQHIRGSHTLEEGDLGCFTFGSHTFSGAIH